MSHETSVQPKLADLLAGYLVHQVGAHTEGLATFDPDAEVLPHEAGPVQPIDARLAWNETLAVAGFFASGLDKAAWKAPQQWSGLVAAHEPEVALACALGNFPQLVRHFHTILQTPTLGQLRPVAGRRNSAPMEGPLGKAGFPQLLLDVGILRLAGQFEQADRIFQDRDAEVPGEWRTAWENERAALAWHRGDSEQACELWQRLEPAVPVLFNRGMAELFLERPERARPALADAVARLPEDGAWHHLGRLYLTLCPS